MGRCYEFGVEIHAGCEQAMVVTAGGGACECRQCETVCPGRFGGCAAVVAVPGRVPASAPSWAVPGATESARPVRTAGRVKRSKGSHGDMVRAAGSAVPAARRAPPPAPAVTSPLSPPAGGSRSNGVVAPDDMVADVLTLVSKLVEQQSEHPPAMLVEAVEALRDEVRDRDEQLAASLEAYAAYQRQLAGEIARIEVEVNQLATKASELTQIAAAVQRLGVSLHAIEERLARPATLRDMLGRRS